MLEKTDSRTASLISKSARWSARLKNKKIARHARRHGARVPDEGRLRSAVRRASDAPCCGEEHRRPARRSSRRRADIKPGDNVAATDDEETKKLLFTTEPLETCPMNETASQEL